jgi:hypothetical protein
MRERETFFRNVHKLQTFPPPPAADDYLNHVHLQLLAKSSAQSPCLIYMILSGSGEGSFVYSKNREMSIEAKREERERTKKWHEIHELKTGVKQYNCKMN